MEASTEAEGAAGATRAKSGSVSKDVTIQEAPAIVQNYQRKEVSRAEVRKFFLPFIFHKASNFQFWRASVFLVIAKAAGIATPFLLKRVINSLTYASGVGATAPAAVSLTRTIRDVGLWGFTRIFSSVCLCYQMNAVTAGI